MERIGLQLDDCEAATVHRNAVAHQDVVELERAAADHDARCITGGVNVPHLSDRRYDSREHGSAHARNDAHIHADLAHFADHDVAPLVERAQHAQVEHTARTVAEQVRSQIDHELV